MLIGGVAKRPKATVCKTVIRRFESGRRLLFLKFQGRFCRFLAKNNSPNSSFSARKFVVKRRLVLNKGNIYGKNVTFSVNVGT